MGATIGPERPLRSKVPIPCLQARRQLMSRIKTRVLWLACLALSYENRSHSSNGS